MSELTRADIQIRERNVGGGIVLAARPVTDAEFDRIAKEQGYVKVFDSCDKCGGSGEVATLGPDHTDPCPDCVDGRVLAEGVPKDPLGCFAMPSSGYWIPASMLEADDE